MAEETKKEAAAVTVIVPANIAPHQVDGFAQDCERSVKGALHIRPATTLTLTADELNHIEKHHPKLHQALIVVKPGPSLADLLAMRAPVTEAAPMDVPAEPEKESEPR